MEIQEFTELVQRQQNNFIGYIVYKTRDHALAEDMTQEAFSRVWEKQNQFQGNNLDGWAFTILSRTLIDHIRHYHRESLTPEGEMFDASQSAPSPEGLWDLIEQLKEMPEIDQEAFMLVAAGYSGKQLSEHWEVPTVTANHRVFRARQRVARLALQQSY